MDTSACLFDLNTLLSSADFTIYQADLYSVCHFPYSPIARNDFRPTTTSVQLFKMRPSNEHGYVHLHLL
jgi:hypothetical protein